jgi:uncharacterized membrane protein YphA (DoxX/SURF4 family)
MKKQSTLAYWVTTGLVAVAFAAGGLGDLSHAPAVTEAMAALGYPAYFLTILGIWKALGAVAITIPRAPRLKEWAYAGIAFDLTEAAASQGERTSNGMNHAEDA